MPRKSTSTSKKNKTQPPQSSISTRAGNHLAREADTLAQASKTNTRKKRTAASPPQEDVEQTSAPPSKRAKSSHGSTLEIDLQSITPEEKAILNRIKSRQQANETSTVMPSTSAGAQSTRRHEKAKAGNTERDQRTCYELPYISHY